MSLKSTKEQLAQLLMEKDNKVIALSGKWGTGKSYMWDQVKASSGDDMVKERSMPLSSACPGWSKSR